MTCPPPGAGGMEHGPIPFLGDGSCFSLLRHALEAAGATWRFGWCHRIGKGADCPQTACRTPGQGHLGCARPRPVPGPRRPPLAGAVRWDRLQCVSGGVSRPNATVYTPSSAKCGVCIISNLSGNHSQNRLFFTVMYYGAKTAKTAKIPGDQGNVITHDCRAGRL